MGSLRKLAVIEGILEIEHRDALVYESASPVVDRHHKDAMVRARILRVALPDLSCKQGIAHITLETRSQPSQGFISHDRRDHEVLQSLLDKGEIDPDFRIDHSGKSEPMLWLAATGDFSTPCSSLASSYSGRPSWYKRYIEAHHR